MLKKLAFVLATVAFFSSANAQESATAPRCDGEVQIVRVSQLKPGVTVSDFEKVVVQHMAWYRSHGYTNNVQKVARIMTQQGFAANKVATIHVNAPGVPREKQDAGWAAFVAAYRAVSDVTEQHQLCLPKP